MYLEDYFDFQRPDDVRLKGTRIGIETILYEYIYCARTAEEIVEIYTSLTLEQVYATILYYLHNKEQVSEYMADWLEWGEQQRQAQESNQPLAAERLRKLRELKAFLRAADARAALKLQEAMQQEDGS